MQTVIQTFSFNNIPVRIEIKDGEPLFCLTDVAEILDIRNASTNRFNMSEAGVHLMYISSGGQKRELTFINEPNLYRVIFRSRKAEAVEFQNWVFEEVLPQIRKTGQYQTEQPQPEPTPTPQVGDYWLSVGKDGCPHIVPLDKDLIITNPSNIMCLRSLLALIPTYQLHEFMKHCTEEVINRAKGMLA